MVVGVPEIAVRLRALVATELWNEGNVAAATAEIRKLGAIDNVDDSLALLVAAKLLPLSDDATTRLLDRAARTGYVAGERVSARLELARALLAAGKADAALVSIDFAIGEARSDGEIPSLVAKALELRWEVTHDKADFQQAQEAIRALPTEKHWRELASLLIDHGDYDSANAVLEPWLERGDVAAHLLAIDSYLRSGKTESAKDLLKRIDKAAVGNDLKFPYAYTTGLVAGVSGDPEIRREAIALLSGLHVAPHMTRVVEQILHAVRGETSDTRSVLERVRHLLTRKT